ncbi:hypothetical protein OHT61_09700 [Streptomyces sp. NBC_00178]|uniref:hypothetical protein n=1 Tax=Streptomyces sp. NBC_00178 TaxID=2975672 RepID=UPI002E2E4B9B|nr:hypothetical protein [Streptomyces sp. NBC_00178]
MHTPPGGGMVAAYMVRVAAPERAARPWSGAWRRCGGPRKGSAAHSGARRVAACHMGGAAPGS